MTSTRDSALLGLQQGLMAPSTGATDVARLDLLPFEAAQARWAVPCTEVVRVMMPADVISLNGYTQLPECVVGAVASENEMLSVVDAGLLLGRERSHSSLKSRLIVFSDGSLKGIALLVDRVHDRVASKGRDAVNSLNRLDAAALQSLLAKKTPTRRDAQ